MGICEAHFILHISVGESRDLNCVVTFSELECEWRNMLDFASFCKADLNLLAGGSC